MVSINIGEGKYSTGHDTFEVAPGWRDRTDEIFENLKRVKPQPLDDLLKELRKNLPARCLDLS